MKISHVTADSLAAAPGIRHAFLSRDGGVSRGIYAGLNCGLGSDDDPGHIQENRARAAQTVGVETHHLRTLYQVHSANVIDADHCYVDATPHADALVCTTPEIAIGVLAADCAPVLLADPQARVIGAAHAGWRGALGGIIESTVELMCDYGATIENINCAIGPCIGKESYEVGAEFMDKFIENSDNNNKFFKTSSIPGKFFFDLSSYTFCRLKAMGVSQISQLDFDTCSDQDRFFSYRRYMVNSEEDFGRGISLIGITDK